MPFELRGSVLPVPRGANRYVIEKWDTVRGTAVADVPPFTHPFNDNKGFASCAKRMGCHEQYIHTIVAQLRAGQANAVLSLNDIATAITFNVRQAASQYPYDDFPSALAGGIARVSAQYGEDATYIEWKDDKQACCLDVDFHDNTAPKRHKVEAFCDVVQPAPSHWWITKRGGAHLIYLLNASFDADELAAVAGYQAVQKFPTGKIELITRTRLPPRGEVARARVPSADTDAIRTLLRQAPENADHTEFLAERGWKIGDTLPHNLCPVAPNMRGVGLDTCVNIRPDGVKCHRCTAAGIHYGSRIAGWFPYSVLAGEVQRTEVANCIEHMTHWTHAKYVMSKVVRQATVAKKVYQSLLKLRHSNDPRIPLAFIADSKRPIIRGKGYWMTELGEPITVSKDSATLAALPGAKGITEADAEVMTRWEDVEALASVNDLTKQGYPAITPVRGIQLTAMQALPHDKLFAVLPPPYATREGNEWRAPQYVGDIDDDKLDAAFRILEEALPGLNRNLLMLLLVGRGCTEHRAGLSPMLLLSGVTSAGKTYHTKLAAEVLGDKANVTHFKKDMERVKQSIMANKAEGGIVMLDEFMKSARLAGASEVEAFQFVLYLDSDSKSHVLYTGPVALGDLPFFVFLDTDYPDAIAGNEQVGRRMAYIRMHERVEWVESCKSQGISEPNKVREEGSKMMVAALNNILSYVMDRWFTGPPTNFLQVAEELGFGKLSEYGGVTSKYDTIRELYRLVCAAPEIAKGSTDRRYFTKRGMKLAQADGKCALYEQVDALISEEERKGGHPQTLRAMNESDIAAAIGADCPVRFEIKSTSWSKFGIRFVSIDGTRVNEELVCSQSILKSSTQSSESLQINLKETIDMNLPSIDILTLQSK